MIKDIRAKFPRSKLPLLVLITGLFLTGLTAYFSLDSVNLSASYRFDRLSSEISDTISIRIKTYESAITQLRGLIQVMPQLDRRSFRTYADNMKLSAQYPGIMGVGFVQVVPPANLQNFVAKVRDEYLNPSLRLWPQTPKQAQGSSSSHYLVRFFEPEMATSNGRHLVGFDVLSDETRRTAFEKARDSGKITLSKPLRLTPDPEDMLAYILIIPVYKPGLAIETPAQKSRALIGFITAAFRAQDLFSEIFDREHSDIESRHHVSFEIVDPALASTDTHPEHLIQASTPTKARGHEADGLVFRHYHIREAFAGAEFQRTIPLDVGDRQLNLRVYSLDGFNPLGSRFLPSLVLIFGTILSIVASLMIRLNEDQAIQIMKSERQMRLITDALPVLISYVDLHGKMLFLNQSFEEWFRKPIAKLMGGRLSEVLGEKNFQLLRPYHERTLAGETLSFDTEFTLPSGRTQPVHVSYVPDFGENAHVRGYIALMTDITARRRQEENHRFLSDLTVLLNSTLDVEEIIHRCANLTLPTLGDWCVISYNTPNGEPKRFCAVLDPNQESIARQLEAVPSLHRRHPIASSIERGDPYLRAAVTDDWLKTISINPAEHELFSKMHIVSAMYLPLKARNRILGTISILSSRAEKVYDNDDLIFAMDLSRRAALAIDNAQLYRDSQLAGRAKDEFLATLSHELRTPMNVISGWLEILRTERLQGAEFDQALTTLSRNAQVQIQLINDLLDISRIVSGKISLQQQPLSLNQAARTGLDSVMPAARAKSIRLESDLTDEDTSITGDPDRLQQVIWNLLSNAVKFTPESGQITVRTSATPHQLQLVVEDSGCGIDPHFIPFIFDRFQQEDGSTTRAQGGLGLGLAIVRSVVELHGGTIEAHSEGRDRGSRFIVRLPRHLLVTSKASARLGNGKPGAPMPLVPTTSTGVESVSAVAQSYRSIVPKSDRTSPPGVSPSAPAQTENDLQGLDILLVDDSKDVRDLITRLLSRRGAKLRTAECAADAFKLIEEAPPDLLISDIGLPEENGLSLMRRIRRMERQLGRRRLPAAALTAYAQTRDRREAIESGFDIHLSKPVKTEDLLAAVHALAQQAERAARGASTAPSA